MIKLEDKVVLITGSARGIGFEYAKLFFNRGAKVIMQDYGVDDDGTGGNPELIEIAAKSISSDSDSVLPININLNTEEECNKVVDSIINKFGRIDALVHNAGWVAYQSIEELTPEFLKRSIDVNIHMPTWLSKAVFPIMKKQNYGRIVFTTSDRAIYEQYGLKGLSHYGIGKMAQIGLMNILSVEGKDYDIKVNSVSPVAKTRMWNVTGEPENLKPYDIAIGTFYLITEECKDSGYILRASNGQFYAVKWEERENVDYPYNINGLKCDTPEEVLDKWSEIKNVIRF